MPRRIERGPSTRHAHEQMSFPFPGVCCLFLVCFFFGVLKAERDELCNAMSIRYGAHRSTGFAARFQPIDRGNRELGYHGKAQTLAGDWAVQARSAAGSLVGASCGAQHAEMHANVPSMYVWGTDGTVCCGRRRQTSNFQRLDARDPGDSRQCFNTGARLFRHTSCPPARPSGHRRRWWSWWSRRPDM